MSDEEDRASSDAQPVSEAQQEERNVISLEEHRKLARDETPSRDIQPGELTRDEMKRIIEALLFAASEPISPARLAKLSGMRDMRCLRRTIEELKAAYAHQKSAFTIEEVAGGYQLMTLPEFHSWVSKLRRSEHEQTLSQAALESLAIIAYKQPITRAEIEDVRGVQSGYILRSLIEKGMVLVTGRSDQLGHPLLYGTSKNFLDAFGLASLDALPTLDELRPSTRAERGSGDAQQ